MKTNVALFLSTASLLHAGAPDLETTLAPKPEPWIKPTIDIRARYEFGDVEPLAASHALTFRERLGLKTQSWKSFLAKHLWAPLAIGAETKIVFHQVQPEGG